MKQEFSYGDFDLLAVLVRCLNEDFSFDTYIQPTKVIKLSLINYFPIAWG